VAKFKLSEKKQIKPTMKGTPIQTNAAVLARYRKRLLRITEMMTKETTSKLNSFFKKNFVVDYFDDQEELDSEQSVTVLDSKSPSSQVKIMLAKINLKYSRLMSKKGGKYAGDMLDQVDRDSFSRVSVSLKSCLVALSIKSRKHP